MGDMKTPDFDDLLAAFDIPDATGLDAKEAIQESQVEAEDHLKHTEMCIDATVSVPHPMITPDAPAVSVIVKNTNRQDSYEPLMERGSAHLGHLLQNGFRSCSGSLERHNNYTMLNTSPMNGDYSGGFLEKIPVTYKTEKVKSPSKPLHEFSPVSSPESEDIQRNGIIEHPDPKDLFLPHDPLFVSADVSISGNHAKTYNLTHKCHKVEPGLNSSSSDDLSSAAVSLESTEGISSDPVTMDNSMEGNGACAYPTPVTNPSSPRLSVKTQATKLSSCCDALVALNTKKDSYEQTSPVVRKDAMQVSPRVPISPRSPRSPLEVVKRLIKQPDSPMSVCSDTSGTASPALVTGSPPALVTGSPPAIPKVRIKTIKTSSGQIKRTVTSILPDSETEDLQSPFGSSPSQSSVEEHFSNMLPGFLSHDTESELPFKNGKQESLKTPPLGCVSANAEPDKRLKKSQSPNISTNLKRNPRAFNQRTASPAQDEHAEQASGCSTKPNYLPKALHLANLNLVPHSVAASVTARVSTQRQECSHLSTPKVCSGVPLVHQVKKTSPKMRAIIPNTAAGTLNRLLNYSNPVPSYVPNLSPPPDSNIKLPAQGYCCLECGDSFGLQKSLAFHYARRSVHIEVTCTLCSKTLVFFNRCALLAHARDHKNKGMMMQCSQLFMKPIAVDQMLTLSKPKQGASLVSQAKCVVPAANSQATVQLHPDRSIFKCVECNKQMSDPAALAAHYQRSSTESGELICKLCKMLLPNKCSFRAHQRIHAHKPPYSCPECGAVANSVDFQKHLTDNCLHYARSIGYLCQHCDVLFATLALLKRHIEEKHCKVFYKCTVCPVAFKSSDGCHTHGKTKHGASEPSHQLIHKCSCESVFKKKQLLYQHLYQHKCIFNCPQCSSFFTQKLALMQHLKRMHRGICRSEKEKGPTHGTELVSHHSKSISANHQSKLHKPNKGVSKEIKDCTTSRKSASGHSKKNAGWTCGECLLWVPDREAYVSHMKKNHGKSVKRSPCRLCDRSFNSSMSLRRHIRYDHDGKKKVFTCWFCTNERINFTKHSMLMNHLSLMHGIKNPDFSLLTKLGSPGTSKEVEMGPKRTADKVPGQSGNCGTSEAPPDKRPKPLFRCAKCGLTTEDLEQFQKHIPQHKTDADTPQCQNCGLCFTSQLARSRHLYIVHKVKEPEDADKKDLVESQGREMQEVEASTNVVLKNQLQPLSPSTSGTEEEPSESVTEIFSKILAPELMSTLNSGSDIQISGTRGVSVVEETERNGGK